MRRSFRFSICWFCGRSVFRDWVVWMMRKWGDCCILFYFADLYDVIVKLLALCFEPQLELKSNFCPWLIANRYPVSELVSCLWRDQVMAFPFCLPRVIWVFWQKWGSGQSGLFASLAHKDGLEAGLPHDMWGSCHVKARAVSRQSQGRVTSPMSRQSQDTSRHPPPFSCETWQWSELGAPVQSAGYSSGCVVCLCLTAWPIKLIIPNLTLNVITESTLKQKPCLITSLFLRFMYYTFQSEALHPKL